MNRRAARLSAAGLLVVVGVATVAGPAVAAERPAQVPAVEICLGEPPEPSNPLSNGPLSVALPRPEHLPAPGDPFAPDSQTTILEQYGSAGPFWATYDNGCPIATTAQVPKLWTMLANLGFAFPQFLVLGTASLANLVLSPGGWLSALDAPVDSVGASLGGVVTPLLALAFTVAAVGVAFAARKGKIGYALVGLAFGLVAVAMFALGTHAPSKIAGTLDSTVSSTVSAALGANTAPGTTGQPMGPIVVGPVWRTVAFDRWCEGVLGSSTDKTAREYCPRLFKAQALTWAEAEAIEGDQAKTDAKIVEKKAEWAGVAAEIKSKNLTAYNKNLTGNEAGGRIGAAALATFVALVVLPFVLVALLMSAAGYIVLRMVAALSPVLAVILVIYRDLLRKLGHIIGAVLINTVVLAFGATAVLGIAGALLKSDMPVMGAVLITGVLSVVAWIILRPFRRLTQMVSGKEAAGGFGDTGKAAKGAGSAVGGAVLAAAGVATGGAAAAAGMAWGVLSKPSPDDDGDDGGSEATRPEAQRQPSTPVAPYQAPPPEPAPSPGPREVPVEPLPQQPVPWSYRELPAADVDAGPKGITGPPVPPSVDPSPADEGETSMPPAPPATEQPFKPSTPATSGWVMYDPATGQNRVETPDE